MPTLLTPDDIREFEPAPELSDDALQLLLDAAEAEIVRYAGASDSAVEWLVGGRREIVLSKPATAIASVAEHIGGPSAPITLAADDYTSDPTGYLLYRLGTGTHPRWRWWGRVAVTYTPTADLAIRKGVELDLVRLMVSYRPGSTSETVGLWTTQLAANSVWNNSRERDSILSRLVVHGRMLVVGG
jgi:hypothetical protein